MIDTFLCLQKNILTEITKRNLKKGEKIGPPQKKASDIFDINVDTIYLIITLSQTFFMK